MLPQHNSIKELDKLPFLKFNLEKKIVATNLSIVLELTVYEVNGLLYIQPIVGYKLL